MTSGLKSISIPTNLYLDGQMFDDDVLNGDQLICQNYSLSYWPTYKYDI